MVTIAPAVDLKRRAIVKTFSWRALASLDTLAIAWVVMTFMRPTTAGETAGVAGMIAAVEVPNKLLLYYLHERLWSRLRFGIPPSAECDV